MRREKEPGLCEVSEYQVQFPSALYGRGCGGISANTRAVRVTIMWDKKEIQINTTGGALNF